MHCEVILFDAVRSFDKPYTYEIPAELQAVAGVGAQVSVPFGRGSRIMSGVISRVMPASETSAALKPLSSVDSPRPVVNTDQLQLAFEMKRRYFCTLGQALRVMVPPSLLAVGDRQQLAARVAEPEEAREALAAGELNSLGHIRVLELLLEYGTVPLAEIRQTCKVSQAVLKRMEQKGLLIFEKIEQRRDHVVSGTIARDQPPQLTPEQQVVVGSLVQATRTAEPGRLSEFLLHGVTGSGKTEVYLQTASDVLAAGRGVIILVPEISLTPQMINRITSRFGLAVAVLHSRLRLAERYEQWQRILRGEVQLVVGARSAIFAPLPDIGLIVIDEEQESTYKSEMQPRYHALEVARIRAFQHQAVLLLGSATPSIESYYRSETNKSVRLSLPDRIGRAGFARLVMVDMRQELAAGNRSVFSRALSQALKDALERQEQAILFINRRGLASTMLCRVCGYRMSCSSCDVTLTEHGNPHAHRASDLRHQLICHYCGKVTPQPAGCPVCGSTLFGRFGLGTQQAELAFQDAFPGAVALRMDFDTTQGRDGHAKLLQQFSEHRADVLIGTQMIAKGHDYPQVTVVGILAADQLTSVADYRASERTFQLLVQAAGRAGRGDLPGVVYVQAYQVDDPVLLHAVNRDFDGFYAREIDLRRRLRYPPFGHLGVVLLTSLSETVAREAAQTIYRQLLALKAADPRWDSIAVSPAAPAPMARIRGRFRYRLVIKENSREKLTLFMQHIEKPRQSQALSLTLDIDPGQMI